MLYYHHTSHITTILATEINMNILNSLAIGLVLLIAGNANAGNNVQPIFEKLTVPQNWVWQTFNNLPKTAYYKDGMKKDQYKTGNFYLERDLQGYSNASITAYGPKNAPNEVVFYAGGWGTTEERGLLKLTDVVNTSNLTKLNSNCNFGKIEEKYKGKDDSGHRYQGMNYIDSQTIYKWTRANAKPLYVVALRGGGYVETSVLNQGINSSVIVVNDIKNLNSAIATHGWNKAKNGKKVICTFN